MFLYVRKKIPEPETPAVSMSPAPTAKERVKKMFSAKRLALMAVFAALSFVVSLFEFPIFPTAANWLKLDFGNVFIMLIAFLFGPVEGVLVCTVKELLRISVSSSGGVGELANIIMTCSFILLPSIVYKFHKGLIVVIPSMFVACFIASGVALLANRYILLSVFGIADSKKFLRTHGDLSSDSILSKQRQFPLSRCFCINACPCSSRK